MTAAKKAAAKSKQTKTHAAQAEDRSDRPDVSNTVADVREADAMPAQFSEAPNGMPSDGPDPDLGMTMVAARSMMSEELAEKAAKGQTVKMSHPHGHEVDVDAADVETHLRTGWTRVEEE